MPFDSANYESEEMQLLLRGRRRIENGWLQNKLSARVGHKTFFCMMGSIMCDDYGVETHNTAAISNVMHYLSDIVGKLTNKYSGYTRRIVPAYNDAPGRTKEDVLFVFDTAIKLQMIDDLHR